MSPNLSDENFEDIKVTTQDNFNFQEALKDIKRNKIFISKVTLGVFIFSCIYLFFEKNIWEGKFQIVIANKTKSFDNPLLKIPSSLGDLVNLQDSKGGLKTELEILKSPSVLMPIYKYVKEQKSLEQNKLWEVSYEDWTESNLKVNLIKGTQVLNLSYRDSNQSLILPVLNRISNAYQDYSERDVLRQNRQGIEYLNKQVEIFLKKSNNSNKEAERYAIKHNLHNRSDISKKGAGSEIEALNASINVPNIRAVAQDYIVKNNSQIEYIEQLTDYKDLISFIGDSFTPTIRSDVGVRVRQLDEKIKILSEIYTEEDPELIKLKNERDILTEVFKKEVISLLKAELARNKVLLKTAQRPPEVLIKYKELLRKSSRDEATLFQLGNSLRLLELEAAKAKNPWELITTPVIGEKPVAPNKFLILFEGILFGGLLGVFLSYIRDWRIGFLSTKDALEKTIGLPILYDLSEEDKKNWDKLIGLIVNNKIKKSGNINLLKIGDIDNEICSNLLSIFISVSNRKVSITDELTQLNDDDVQIIVTKLGVTNKKQLLVIKKRISIATSQEFYLLMV